jgi:hypothetical protein
MGQVPMPPPARPHKALPQMRGNYRVTFIDGTSVDYMNVLVEHSRHDEWIRFYAFDAEEEEFPMAAFNPTQVRYWTELDDEGQRLDNGAF